MPGQPPAPVPGPVLGVWAHPDDETWLSAIHMLRCVQAGVRVACVTATRGEQGSPDPVRWPTGEPLAKLRTAELERALALLGVTDHQWLDYEDGRCDQVPCREGADRILVELERVRPATVLTFGPDGMTGHADHQAVSAWVDSAVSVFSGPAPQVLHATNAPQWLAQWRPTMDSLGVFMGAEPPCDPVSTMRSHLRLTPAESELKMRALLCQESQLGPLVAAFGPDRFLAAMTEESYR